MYCAKVYLSSLSNSNVCLEPISVAAFWSLVEFFFFKDNRTRLFHFERRMKTKNKTDGTLKNGTAQLFSMNAVTALTLTIRRFPAP